MELETLKNKQYLIIGATSGIGSEIVKFLTGQKADLILVGRNEEKLELLAKQSLNIKATYTIDFRYPNQMEEIFKSCSQNNIKFDGMVHCVGMNIDMPVKNIDQEIMEEMMAVNFYSFIESMKYFLLKKYSNDLASSVVISSTAMERGEKGRAVYQATKGAINASLSAIAKEALKRGIRVNALSLGFTDTEFIRNQNDLRDFDAYIKQLQPLGLIDPSYVAPFVGYLLSEESKYLTGLAIPFDAGGLL